MNDTFVGNKIMNDWLGIITDSQIKTLNLWPLVYFVDLDKHTLIIDQNTQTITYKMKFKPKAKIDSKWLNKIALDAQFLLGENWTVYFYKGRKLLYLMGPKGMVL